MSQDPEAAAETPADPMDGAAEELAALRAGEAEAPSDDAPIDDAGDETPGEPAGFDADAEYKRLGVTDDELAILTGGEPKAPKAESPKGQTPKADAPKADAPKPELSSPEASASSPAAPLSISDEDKAAVRDMLGEPGERLLGVLEQQARMIEELKSRPQQNLDDHPIVRQAREQAERNDRASVEHVLSRFAPDVYGGEKPSVAEQALREKVYGELARVVAANPGIDVPKALKALHVRLTGTPWPDKPRSEEETRIRQHGRQITVRGRASGRTTQPRTTGPMHERLDDAAKDLARIRRGG